MVKALFFDFFGVVGCEITSIWFKAHNITENIDKMRKEIFPLTDNGDITEDENFLRLSALTNIPAKEIKEEWRSLFYVNSSLIEAIDELRKEYKVYILSNAAASYLNDLLDAHDIRKHFDGIYISSDMRRIKPNEEFFEYVLEDLGLDASEAVMTDDNEKNIEGAKSAGLKGIVFKNTEQYIEDLKKII